MKKQKGYIIEMFNADIKKEWPISHYYFVNVVTANENTFNSIDFYDKPRTLIYVADSCTRPKDCKDGIFFEDKSEAEDVITMLKTYQDYDEELIGPFPDNCKFEFIIIETELKRKYVKLKDFTDRDNHMDFDKEMDASKKWFIEKGLLKI